ncbi:arylsulfatase [Oceaniferula spumae]|uniref:Arylsulfatase n=1 Tax=Oceaniferula spumae TaxID=2979115 RepID=A0AAT9FMA9_9BACT
MRILLTLILTCLISHAAEKPNVIIIYADDLGYGDFSCYGATGFKTPNCDKLAEQGIKFTDAHSPSAVCTPSRYGLLTGRYAWRTWMKNWVLQEHMPLLIDSERFTLPKLFKQQGYTTGCIGKWHLGWGTKRHEDLSKPVTPGPNEVGFDYFFGPPHSHNSAPAYQVFVRNNKVDGIKEGENFKDPKVIKRLKRSLPDTATELSKEAVRWITEHKDEPFFLYYPTTNIHFPLTPAKRFQGKTKTGKYGDFVYEFDWAVGEILNTLDKLKLSDNTIVILSSDNGGEPYTVPIKGNNGKNPHRPNSNFRGKKASIYEAGHRIPFIVRWPGKVKPNSTSAETICHTDLLATFAAHFGTTLPNNAAEDSYNILPAILAKPYQSPIREATVHHSVSGMFAIRKGDWKLIEGNTDGRRNPASMHAWNNAGGLPIIDEKTGEILLLDYANIRDFDQKNPIYQLYNLKTDPQEKDNLAKSQPEKVKELANLLEKYRNSGRSTPLIEK